MAKPKSKMELIRRQQLLSQKEVAQQLGFSQQFLGKIESGKARLTVDVAKKLKRIYNLNCIDDLIDEDSPKNKAV